MRNFDFSFPSSFNSKNSSGVRSGGEGSSSNTFYQQSRTRLCFCFHYTSPGGGGSDNQITIHPTEAPLWDIPNPFRLQQSWYPSGLSTSSLVWKVRNLSPFALLKSIKGTFWQLLLGTEQVNCWWGNRRPGQAVTCWLVSWEPASLGSSVHVLCCWKPEPQLNVKTLVFRWERIIEAPTAAAGFVDQSEQNELQRPAERAGLRHCRSSSARWGEGVCVRVCEKVIPGAWLQTEIH